MSGRIPPRRLALLYFSTLLLLLLSGLSLGLFHAPAATATASHVATATEPHAASASHASPARRAHANFAPAALFDTIFTVNSTGDGADNNPGDGFCNDGTGNCTLRAAIMESNAFPGTDAIAFNIAGAGVHTISPASALPAITDAVIIDGYTQPGPSPNT